MLFFILDAYAHAESICVFVDILNTVSLCAGIFFADMFFIVCSTYSSDSAVRYSVPQIVQISASRFSVLS